MGSILWRGKSAAPAIQKPGLKPSWKRTKLWRPTRMAPLVFQKWTLWGLSCKDNPNFFPPAYTQNSSSPTKNSKTPKPSPRTPFQWLTRPDNVRPRTDSPKSITWHMQWLRCCTSLWKLGSSLLPKSGDAMGHRNILAFAQTLGSAIIGQIGNHFIGQSCCCRLWNLRLGHMIGNKVQVIPTRKWID